MSRRDRIPDSDLADLGTEYGQLTPQHQWAAIPDEPEPWWADLVLAIVVFVLGAGAGTLLYFMVRGFE